jgi:hypothetical protein
VVLNNSASHIPCFGDLQQQHAQEWPLPTTSPLTSSLSSKTCSFKFQIASSNLSLLLSPHHPICLPHHYMVITLSVSIWTFLFDASDFLHFLKELAVQGRLFIQFFDLFENRNSSSRLKTGSLVLWELSVEDPIYLTETHWFFLWKNKEQRHNGQNRRDFASKKSSKKMFLRGIWDPLVLPLEKQRSAPHWAKQKSFCF